MKIISCVSANANFTEISPIDNAFEELSITIRDNQVLCCKKSLIKKMVE